MASYSDEKYLTVTESDEVVLETRRSKKGESFSIPKFY